MSYYNPDKLFSYNAKVFVSIGARGIGKTYAMLNRAVKRWKKYGEEFVILRRNESELDNKCLDEIAEVNNIAIRISANVIYVVEVEKFAESKAAKQELNRMNVAVKRLESKLLLTEDVKIIEQLNELKNAIQRYTENNAVLLNYEATRCGYMYALSNAQNYKSIPHPKVKRIIFDEFIIEDTRYHQYLKKEPDKLASIYSTIARSRDVELIMLSNAGFTNNPYFAAWNFEPTNKEFTKVPDKDIIIEISNMRGKTGNLSAFASDDYLTYANDNTFRDASDYQISPQKVHNWNLAFDEFSICYLDYNGIYVSDEPNKVALKYTSEPGSDGFYSAKLIKNFQKAVNSNMIKFSSKNCRNKFISAVF